MLGVFRSVLVGVSFVAATGVMVLIGSAEVVAQQPRPAPQRTPATQPPTAPATAPSAPQRVETITYDSWTVTCQDAPGVKKSCSAALTLALVQEGRRQVLGAWVIRRNDEGVLQTLLYTPQIQPGIQIQKGVDLKLGAAAPRKLSYVACSPRQCEASVAMDANMVRDALAAANATITIYASNGKDLNLNLASLKGIDKVISTIGGR